MHTNIQIADTLYGTMHARAAITVRAPVTMLNVLCFSMCVGLTAAPRLALALAPGVAAAVAGLTSAVAAALKKAAQVCDIILSTAWR